MWNTQQWVEPDYAIIIQGVTEWAVQWAGPGLVLSCAAERERRVGHAEAEVPSGAAEVALSGLGHRGEWQATVRYKMREKAAADTLLSGM